MTQPEINTLFVRMLPALMAVFIRYWGSKERGLERAQEGLCHAFEWHLRQCLHNDTPPPLSHLLQHSILRVNDYRRFSDGRCDWSSVGSEGAQARHGVKCHRMLAGKTEIEEEERIAKFRKRLPDPLESALVSVDFDEGFMPSLPPRLQGVVRLALKDHPPEEVAELYHVSRARVSQMRADVQGRLADYWHLKRKRKPQGRKRRQMAAV